MGMGRRCSFFLLMLHAIACCLILNRTTEKLRTSLLFQQLPPYPWTLRELLHNVTTTTTTTTTTTRRTRRTRTPFLQDLLYIWVVVSSIFYFQPLPGEMSQFDWYFSNGLKPPTSICFLHVSHVSPVCPSQHSTTIRVGERWGVKPPNCTVKWWGMLSIPFQLQRRLFRDPMELFLG